MRTWEVDDKVNYYWHYNKWGKLKYKSGQANCIGWWWWWWYRCWRMLCWCLFVNELCWKLVGRSRAQSYRAVQTTPRLIHHQHFKVQPPVRRGGGAGTKFLWLPLKMGATHGHTGDPACLLCHCIVVMVNGGKCKRKQNWGATLLIVFVLNCGGFLFPAVSPVDNTLLWLDSSYS